MDGGGGVMMMMWHEEAAAAAADLDELDLVYQQEAGVRLAEKTDLHASPYNHHHLHHSHHHHHQLLPIPSHTLERR